MSRAGTWLIDDRRARSFFWIVIAVNIGGAIISIAFYKQQHVLTDAAFLLSDASIVALIVTRAIAVNAPWLGVLGVCLQLADVVVHWHPVGAIGLLVPFGGIGVMFVLVFYVHPRKPPVRDKAIPNVSEAAVPHAEAVAILDAASTSHPKPGEPDFTYPSPPR